MTKKKKQTKPVEVCRIFPVYFKVSKKGKIRFLDLMAKWVAAERERLIRLKNND